MRTWLGASATESGPLFRPVAKGDPKSPALRVGSGALTPRSVRRIIRARAEAAGLGPENPSLGRVSGHSLRVGTAQSLAARGATVIEM